MATITNYNQTHFHEYLPKEILWNFPRVMRKYEFQVILNQKNFEKKLNKLDWVPLRSYLVKEFSSLLNFGLHYMLKTLWHSFDVLFLELYLLISVWCFDKMVQCTQIVKFAEWLSTYIYCFKGKASHSAVINYSTLLSNTPISGPLNKKWLFHD